MGAAILALLVWSGRRSRRFGQELRIAKALLAALAAAAAVALGLRGGWMASIGLVALSAYLARSAVPRGDPGASGNLSDGSTSLDEARSILGVGLDASRADIDAAYRRLMVRAHPD
ncbi:MAG: molecular chaperone DnaJ, partial [Caulobacteraceae bacterium]|nr:molecular chaperone DnaJ [Caulobacteraceae bacterium]